MPGINAVGTNTAARIRAMPITGPETSSFAFKEASLGESPCSMLCSTASTTTMASSTIKPIASTKPNRENGKSADQRHRHSQKRNQSSPPSLKKDKHHENDENDGFNDGVINLDNAFSHRKSRIESHSIVKSRWKAFFRLSH